MSPSNVMQLIHGENVYENFPWEKIPYRMHTWPQSSAPIFEAIITEVKPKIIIEVGSWLGGSAINMAEICKEQEMNDTTIICVDTWLGGYGEISDPESKKHLFMRNGSCGIYWQFLANVCQKGHQDMIVPIQNTSIIGSKLIEDAGLKADVIFIDGSHLEEDVYSDMRAYHALLRDENSQMFGDDLHSPPVEKAVERFCKDFDLEYCNIGDHFWTVEKSDDSDSDADKE